MPLPHAGGRQYRSRPIIPVAVVGPSNTRVVEALVDSGADDTVFSDQLAVVLGVDLSRAPTITSAGVGGAPLVVRLAEVTLRVADNQEQREWRAWVAFAPIPLRRALLGQAGFLDYFTATFHGHLAEVELAVNPAYPGS